MNFRFLYFLLFSLALNLTYGQNNTFFRKYNLSGMQGALQLEITDDGGFIATGQHEGSGSHGDCDIYVYKLDVCGNIEWFKLYGTGAQEGGKSIIKLNDGGFLVSGLYSGSGTYRAFNMKIDANGNMIWIKRYAFEWMLYAKEAANGDIISLGKNTGSLFLMRTDSNGGIIWSKQITGFGDTGLWLDELANGDIIYTSVNNSISKDFSVGRLNSSGNPIWMKAYGGSGWSDVDHSIWTSKGLVDMQDSSVIITSLTLSGGLSDQNILLAKLSLNNGNVIWSNVCGGNGRDQSRDIAKYPGGYAIIGHTSSFPTSINPSNQIYEALGEKDILLFTVNHNGQLNWARTYGGSERDKGIGVKYNNDNGFSISAITTSPYFGNTDDSFDPLFIKTDSIGFVGCQMFTPALIVNSISLTSATGGSVNPVSIASDVPAISVIDFLPSDQYICQTCTSVPEFTISDTTVCVNDSVYFSNTTMVGLTCFQQWNVNGISIDGTIDPVMTFSTPGTYTIYLYSSCGVNSDTTIKTITVIAPQITSPDFLCTGAQPLQLQANLSNGIWSGNGVSNSGIFSCNGLGTGYQNIYFTIPQYCTVQDSIEIRPLPNVNAGLDTSFCYQSNYVMQGNNSPNTSVIWSPSAHLSGTTISNPTFAYDNINATNAVLTYTYQLTDLQSTCSASDDVSYTIFPVAPLSAGNDTLLCLGIDYVSHASGQGTLTWLPNSPNGSLFSLPLGIQTLVVSQVDNNSCTQTDTVLVTIVENPTVDAGVDTLICLGDILYLNALSPQQVSYQWNTNTPNGGGFTAPIAGNQNLIVQVEDANFCIGLDTLLLSVQDLPMADFDYLVDCYSTNVQLTNQTSFTNLYSDQLNYVWYLNGIMISSSMNAFTYDFNSSGNATVSLVSTTLLGLCKDSSAQIIEVPTNPNLDFNYVQLCDYIASFQSIVPVNETVMSSYWMYANSNFGTNDLSPEHGFPGAGNYMVEFSITNDYPCQYNTQKIITLVYEETLEEQTIPNVITMNYDGINDEINFSEILDVCLEFEIIILNRWGNVIFKTNEQGPAFSGKDLSDNELLEGVYFYKITSGDSVSHGHITIIK